MTLKPKVNVESMIEDDTAMLQEIHGMVDEFVTKLAKRLDELHFLSLYDFGPTDLLKGQIVELLEDSAIPVTDGAIDWAVSGAEQKYREALRDDYDDSYKHERD